MAQGETTHLLRRFFASRTFVIAGILVIIFLGFAFARAYYQNQQVHEEISRLQAETERLQSKKSQTLEMLKYAESQAYVEEKARTELNLVKNGENVVVINNKNDLNNGQASNTVVKSASPSNFILWWNYFFNHD